MSRRGDWEGNDSLCFAAPPPHAELGGGGGLRNPSQRVVANFWRGGIAVRFFVEYLWQKWFLFFGKVLSDRVTEIGWHIGNWFPASSDCGA